MRQKVTKWKDELGLKRFPVPFLEAVDNFPYVLQSYLRLESLFDPREITSQRSPERL